MDDSRVGQGRYKMILEHFVMPRGREVLKKDDGDISQGHRSQFEKFPLAKSGTA